jgi:hypothetical protein
VVDPDNGNQPTGTNQVVTESNTNVTGKVEPYSDPVPKADSTYTTMMGAGQTGAVYFDVTYPNRQSVPAHISHQVSATGPPVGDPPTATTYTAIIPLLLNFSTAGNFS